MEERHPQRHLTATRILDVAERLVQVRGFNAFSYADIATELKMTKAALHYHFVGKADLGEALIRRYTSRFVDALTAIEARTTDAPTRLAAYADLYLKALREQRMCLCGMLAAEFETLPAPMRDGVIAFFGENETWLYRVLEKGLEEGTIEFEESPAEVARMIIGCLQGAMLIARPYGDTSTFQSLAGRLLKGLRAPSPKTSPSPSARRLGGTTKPGARV
jgi:TetR/AcrR family transcriptional repressor of nem operon